MDGEIHAGGVFSMLGDTCVYLLGATTEAGLKTKASHYLHWQVIKAARSRGVKWYDLGGVNPAANPGGYNFKKGFGGEDVIAAGPYEIAKENLSSYIAKAAELAFRRLRK
jgi:lipid II:glycine glycyltransferase (peptidoglycan interpeptide bridge formation enzyme)